MEGAHGPTLQVCWRSACLTPDFCRVVGADDKGTQPALTMACIATAPLPPPPACRSTKSARDTSVGFALAFTNGRIDSGQFAPGQNVVKVD